MVTERIRLGSVLLGLDLQRFPHLLFQIKEEIKKAKTQSQCGECRNVVRKLETQLEELNNELSDVKNKLQTSQAKQVDIRFKFFYL